MTFEDFWCVYPRRLNKAQALKSYNTAIKKGTSHAKLIESVSQFRDYVERNGIAIQFVPHASTWLNGERYNNDYTKESYSQPAQNRTANGRESQISMGMVAAVKIVQDSFMAQEPADKSDDTLDWLYSAR